MRLRSCDSAVADGYVLERLTFELEDAGPVRAYVTRPTDAAGRHPAILYAHAHGDRQDIGAAELIDGRPELRGPYGPLLARAGYVALCLDLPTFGERANILESAAAKAHLWYGTSLIGQMLSEQTAALSYLAGRDDVDAERIGAFGLSLGATLSYWHAALDTRIGAVAHLCCYADFATLVELGAHDHHGLYLVVPGMLGQTSTGEIAGLVAPRPQLICLGDEDELTPPLSVERALAVTRPMYEAAGAARALEVFVQAGVGHLETPQMRERVLAFFARELQPGSTT
ncbi:MAG TPA: dienelactone hydrolase family protein [Candidatus Limnocylindrales bacterium]|jgi:dienelactone hydrolase|nr:dienelactone hydrolase family protein [Candidatus Limnocylindrales bacterium]